MAVWLFVKMRKFLFTLVFLIATVPSVFGADRYVSTTASGTGTGTIGSPWTIWQAKALPTGLAAGDTVYLRGGVYDMTSQLPYSDPATHYWEAPSSSAGRVTFKSYPGEWAHIKWDYSIILYSDWMTFEDLEFSGSLTRKVWPSGWSAGRPPQLRRQGKHIEIVNCVLHDMLETDTTNFADDTLTYGNVFNYFGMIVSRTPPNDSESSGTFDYLQAQNGPVLFRHNIAINQMSHGMQAYGTDSVLINNVTIQENLIAAAGSQAKDKNTGQPFYKWNMMLWTGETPPTNIKYLDNFFWKDPADTAANIVLRGSSGTHGNNLEIKRNLFAGGSHLLHLGGFNNISSADNVFFDKNGRGLIIDEGISASNHSTSTHNNNTYYTTASTPFTYAGVGRTLAQFRTLTGWDSTSTISSTMPTTARVAVHANLRKAGRAVIFIHNPDLQNNVTVSLATSGLNNGQAYKICDSQNYRNPYTCTAVHTGTYNSSSPNISLNVGGMTARAAMLGESDSENDGWLDLKHTTKEIAGLILIATDSVADTEPPVISGVAAGTPGSTVATITWATNEAATSRVYYDTVNRSSDTNGSLYASSSANDTTADLMSHSVGLSSLTANTTYYAKVRSADAAGNVAFSSQFTFTTAAGSDTTPPVISNISPGNPTHERTYVTWSTNELATSRVFWDSVSRPSDTNGSLYAFSNDNDTTANNTSHSRVLEILTSNTIYYYKIRSADEFGNVSFSSQYSFQTQAVGGTPPAAPTGLTAVRINSTTVQLQWTDNSNNEDSFIVERSSTGTGGWGNAEAFPANTTNPLMISLTPAAVQYFRVRATNGAGDSTYSNVASAYTSLLCAYPNGCQ